MVIGIGLDIVSIKRIEEAIEKWGNRFKERIFTEKEIRYCESKRYPAPHFAVRFSAKEAFYKALGNYQKSGIRWREIEVIRGPEGRPAIQLHGLMKGSLERVKNLRILLTMTHDNGIAASLVVMEGDI